MRTTEVSCAARVRCSLCGLLPSIARARCSSLASTPTHVSLFLVLRPPPQPALNLPRFPLEAPSLSSVKGHLAICSKRKGQSASAVSGTPSLPPVQLTQPSPHLPPSSATMATAGKHERIGPVLFPFKPYASQVQVISGVLRALKQVRAPPYPLKPAVPGPSTTVSRQPPTRNYRATTP